MFFGNDLGRVEHVIGLRLGKLAVERLDAQFPFGERAAVDGFVKVAAVIIIVRSLQFQRLIPNRRLQTEFWLPVEFNESRSARCVDELEGVHTKAFDHSKRARDRAVGHRPHQHMRGFGHERRPVPECVVRAARLRIARIRFHFYRVHEVGKFHRVLDEEHGDIVADQIPIPFAGVKFDREAAHVARGIDRTRATRDGGEAREDRGLGSLFEQRRLAQVGNIVGCFEKAVRCRSACVDDPFGNPLMVEMEDFFAKHEIFEQRRSARSRFEAVLIVGNANALIGGQMRLCVRVLTFFGNLLVGFAAIAKFGFE